MLTDLQKLSKVYSSVYLKEDSDNDLAYAEALEGKFQDYFSRPQVAYEALQKIRNAFDSYKKNPNQTTLQHFLDGLEVLLSPTPETHSNGLP